MPCLPYAAFPVALLLPANLRAANRAAVATVQGIPAIVQALKKHAAKVDVLEEGLGALLSACSSSPGKQHTHTHTHTLPTTAQAAAWMT